MTRYERAWDQYSREWREGVAGAPGPLGSEWGDDALTRRVFDELLGPALEQAREGSVLEIGPGGGKYSALAAPRCARLICADVSNEMLTRTRERLDGCEHLVTHKLDGVDLAGIDDGSIDLAFAIDVFIHLDAEDVYVYLRELLRVMRPGAPGVLHFANLTSFAGWDQFVREADLNRAEFKQIGRISFFTSDVIERMIRGLGFEVDRVDTEMSPRDIFVAFHKPRLDVDETAERRREAITARGGDATVVRDVLGELPLAVRVAPGPEYIQRARIALAGDERDVLLAHPPALVGVPLTVPAKARFVTAIGVHPDYQSACCPDGIDFRVVARAGREVSELFARRLDPVNREEDRTWHEVAIDLAPFAGRVVFLTLETAVPSTPNEGNVAAFAAPAIVTP